MNELLASQRKQDWLKLEIGMRRLRDRDARVGNGFKDHLRGGLFRDTNSHELSEKEAVFFTFLCRGSDKIQHISE